MMGVQLARFYRVVRRMRAVARSGVRMMSRRLRVIVFIVFCCFAMMTRGVRVVIGCSMMMLGNGMLVGHRFYSRFCDRAPPRRRSFACIQHRYCDRFLIAPQGLSNRHEPFTKAWRNVRHAAFSRCRSMRRPQGVGFMERGLATLAPKLIKYYLQDGIYSVIVT
jgi:hypothetical protein